MTARPELVEAQLRASEARLRAILDSEPECVKTVSLDGRVLEMNPAGLRMLEADDAAEVLGREILEWVHPEDRAAFRELHRQAAGGGSGLIQFRIVGLKGTARWMETHSVPLRAGDGTVVSVLSVTRDISESKRAEVALRESEDRYRDLVENGRDLICTHDLEGKLLSVNEAAVRLTGYPRAALLRMNLADLLAPEVRGDFGEYLKTIRATGRASGMMRIRTADGETRYWSYSNSLRTEGVSVPVVRGLVQDVTDAKLARAALRQSEAKYRALIENMGEGLIMVDDSDFIRFVNPQICRMLGYTEAELLGQNAATLLLREVDRAAMAERNQRRTGGVAEVYEVEQRKKSGEFIWTRFSATPVISAEGRVTGSMALVADITARKRADDALREAENRLRTIVEGTKALLVGVDANGHFTFVNEATAAAVGYASSSELIGKPYLHFIHPEDRQRVLDTFIDQANNRRPSCIQEFRLVDTAGNVKWFSFLSSLEIKDGQVVGQSGVAQDVTEHRRAEEAAKESEDRFRRIVDNIHDAIYVDDTDARVTFANDQFLTLFGFERDQLSHVKLEDYVAPEWRTALRDRHERRLRGEAVPSSFLYEGLGPNGRRLWLESTVVLLFDDQGRAIGTQSADRDITQRKLAEDAILTEKAFSEALLDSLPGIFFLFDQTGRFLRWNRALEAVSGYSSPEIAAMHPLAFITAMDRGSVAETIQRVFEHGFADVEAALAVKDGEQIPYYFTGARFIVDGAPCCIGTGIDVTARKVLEAELRQSQKIEAIGRLAGGVAHDFNNIVGVILGYGELAESELAPGSPAREYVAEMVQAAQRAATLTRQLQAFSRKQVLQPRRLDLNELIANAHKMLDRLIGEDLSLVVRPAPELGTVLADPGQIDQILLNLAINARDAMPTGGTLTLETADVDLREVDATADRPAIKPGRYVMVAVSDTGAGMDAETQRRLFEPFFTTKPVGQGTGLGLAMVYGIVKQSGGYIWVYSEPGLGTTFKIYLPRVDELPDGNPPSDASAITGGGSEKILLVEDNPALREMIRRRLAASGYTVLLAADGEAALTLAEAHPEPIDLLLTDVVMPKLGGAELAQRLGALRPGLRVLFMSGYTDGAIVHHGVLEDGVVLLEKPFSGEKLLRTVREVLDQPPRIDSAERPERPGRP